VDESLIALIHSPLTGPALWEPVAERLRSLGRNTAVPDLTSAADADPPHYAAFAATAAEQIGESQPNVVLVGHSGAGALLPSIAGQLRGVAGAVFVDALLPHPGATWFDTAPWQLRRHLLDLADGDRLPPWNAWFPPATIEALLPDSVQRERFAEELPRMPLAYFEERAPDPDGWPPQWCVYLRLSEGYRDQEAHARRLGWETHEFETDHLAPLTRPGPVADRIDAVVTAHRR
jgi:hypothetical protein